MRKFFSFNKSSSTPTTDDATKSSNSQDSKDQKVHWEKPVPPPNIIQKKDEEHLRMDTSPRTNSITSHHRRNHSLSSPANSNISRDNHILNSFQNSTRSPSSFSNSSRHSCRHRTNLLQSSSPKTASKSKKKNMLRDDHHQKKTTSFQTMDTDDDNNHSSALQPSPCNSSVLLRCHSDRSTKISNNGIVLDRYIDGSEEHEDRKFKISSDFENDCLFPPNSSRRPPRSSHSTAAPFSPIYGSQNPRSYSFGEARDFHPHHHRWSKLNSRDFDSDTTATVEDIYEDHSILHPGHRRKSGISSRLSGHHQHRSWSSKTSCLNGDDSVEDFLALQRRKYIIGDKFKNNDEEEEEEEDRNDQLYLKLKESEEGFMLNFKKDLEDADFGNFSIPQLVQVIKDINGDRKNLVSKLLTQMKSQISERSSMKQTLIQTNVELDTRTRRLENEKNEIQMNLEKEIDRRSNDWSVKLEKFQFEEKRLRERVQELAEQNVCLQREMLNLSTDKEELRCMIVNLESQVNELTANLEEVNIQNRNLHQSSTEFDCINASYKQKEKEIKDYQKIIRRFQRTCCEQEKSITGLRQGFSSKMGDEDGMVISRLQMEQIRLTGVEQTLRKELESCRSELKSIRQENICIFDRLRRSQGGCGMSEFRLDQELQSLVKTMETTGMSLVDAYNELCSELLSEFSNNNKQISESEEYSFVDYNCKFQSLKAAGENWKRSLGSMSDVLDEKLRDFGFNEEHYVGNGSSKESMKSQNSEDDLELELKAERLLTRILKEKMCSKEVEIEQLHGDIATLLREDEISKSEIQRMKDEISSLTHKSKDFELQMLRKDESFKQVELDLKEYKQEYNASRDILPKVSDERDRMWDEVQRLTESNMFMNYENKSLKNKIETLDEEILLKEGQITILKDSLDKNQFDLLCGPNTLKEYA